MNVDEKQHLKKMVTLKKNKILNNWYDDKDSLDKIDIRNIRKWIYNQI
jgi:hypothetical protein